jgi:hypothetical protein
MIAKTRPLLAALLLSLAADAAAQVSLQLQVRVPLPPTATLVFAAPQVQVVEDWDQEVFFVSGAYWYRGEGHWYRAPGPRAAFVRVEPARVPPVLVALPPGHYRHWRKDQARHAEMAWKAEKEREKAERKASKEARKHARGHGHGG